MNAEMKAAALPRAAAGMKRRNSFDTNTSTTPSKYDELAAMRSRGERPLGGILVTDAWRILEQGQRMDLCCIYFRKHDDWSRYQLDALRDLHVLIHLQDITREAEAVAAVSRWQPRSCRLWTAEGSRSLFGGAEAAREVLNWILARARQRIAA